MLRSRLTATAGAAAALALAACASDPAMTDPKGGGMAAPTPPASAVSGNSAREAPPAAIVAMAGMKTPAPPRADADMQAVLDALTALNAAPIGTVSPAEQRRQPTPADAVKRVMMQQGRSTAPDAAVTTMDMTYPGAAGPVPARIYRPAGATGPLPVIMYIHGGGWVIANLDVYDATPRALARTANAIVVSVSYRQAPENKFPAAHDDANAAYRWVLANAAAWGGDPRRIALAGESAGGNLATNVSIAARDAGLPMPVHQLLVYPVAGSDMNTPSYLRNAAAMPLSKAGLMWFFHYVPRTPADGQDPRVNLVAANLRGLPATTIIAAEIDPLTSEGEQLTARLRAAGVQVERRQYDGVTHEFFGMSTVVKDAYDAQAYAVGRLKGAFGTR